MLTGTAMSVGTSGARLSVAKAEKVQATQARGQRESRKLIPANVEKCQIRHVRRDGQVGQLIVPGDERAQIVQSRGQVEVSKVIEIQIQTAQPVEIRRHAQVRELIGEDQGSDQVRHVRGDGEAGESIPRKVEFGQRGQTWRQSNTGELVAFEKKRVQIRQPLGNGALDQRIKSQIEKVQLRQSVRQDKVGEVIVEKDERIQIGQRARNREVREGVGIKVKRVQISSGFQSLHAADAPADRAQAGQTEHVLFGQRAGGFAQGLANRGVQPGIWNGNFLRVGRDHEAGQYQRGDPAMDVSFAFSHAGWKPERGDCSAIGMGLTTHHSASRGNVTGNGLDKNARGCSRLHP